MRDEPVTKPKEYIITEEQIDYIEKNSVCLPELYDEIRSHPAPDIGLVGLSRINDRLRMLYPDDFALQLNEQQLKQEQKKHDVTIAYKAREETLDEVLKLSYLITETSYRGCHRMIDPTEVESLRSTKQQGDGK